MKPVFHHQRLDVYKAAIDFVVTADAVVTNLPRGRGYLADQLRRAATSIALNIAEGAGEFSPQEKARFYRMARRSATECVAVFDVCQCLEFITQKEFDTGYTLLQRIVSMLTRIVQANSGTETDTDTETGRAINALPS